MPARRQVERFEFSPPTTATVLDAMRALSDACDGWMNLLPGVPEEEAETRQGGIFSALFGGAQEPVSMCTWMPAGGRRGGTDEQTVGILHPRGRHAASQLGELGAPIPAGWRIRQDHARRGLIVRPAASDPPSAVLDWMLRAGAVLATVPITGTWQARVYLPLPGPRNTGGPLER